MNQLLIPGLSLAAIARQRIAPLVATAVPPAALATAAAKHLQDMTSSIALMTPGRTGAQAISSPQFVGFGKSAPRSVVEPGWTTVSPPPTDPTMEAFDRLVDLRVATAGVAMHLESAWRAGLFGQLDHLLEEESWNPADILPSPKSFRTFLRLVILLGRPKRPSLGCGDGGEIIASWSHGRDRLTLECRPDDRVRWVLIKDTDDQPETASGTCGLDKLLSRLAPYDPGIWFYGRQDDPGHR